MTNNRSCSINFPDPSGVEVVCLHPEKGESDYQPDMEPAKVASMIAEIVKGK